MMESRRMNMLESCWFRTQFLLHRSSLQDFMGKTLFCMSVLPTIKDL